MTEIATSWKPGKERGKKYKLKILGSTLADCLKPLRVAVREPVPSSFRPNKGEAQFKVVHGFTVSVLSTQSNSECCKN